MFFELSSATVFLPWSKKSLPPATPDPGIPVPLNELTIAEYQNYPSNAILDECTILSFHGIFLA